MAMKAVRIMVCCIGFLIALSSMLMLVSPVISLSTVDYGRPIKYEWVQKEGGKSLSIDYEITLEKTIVALQDAVNFPVRLSWIGILVLGAFLFLVHVFWIGSFYPINRVAEVVFVVDFLAWLITVVVLMAAPVIGYWHFDTGNVLWNTIPDQELFEAILRDFWSEAIIERMMLSFLLSLPVSIIFHECSVHVYDVLRSAVASSYGLFWERVLREQEREIFSSNIERDLIQILNDDSLEVFRLDCSVRWTPFPMLVFRKAASVQLSLDRLFHFLTAGSKATAFGELREKLARLWGERLMSVGGDVIASFRNESIKVVSMELKRRIAEAKIERLDHARERVEDFVHRVVEVSLRQFRAELAQIGTSEIGILLQDLKECLRSEISSRLDCSMSGGRELLENNEGLFPQGTRFCFREGRNAAIVIEQAPQVRSIRVSHRLSGSRNKDRYALAFPYTVFVVSLENGYFRRLNVFYRNNPIASLDDELFRANVPNIERDSSVCLRFPGHAERGIFARASEVVGYFWESEFNTDLREWYEMYQERESVFSSFDRWEVESRRNPSFMLTVQWVSSQTTLRSVIAVEMNRFERERVEDAVSRNLERAFSQGMEGLQGALMKKMSALRVERRHSHVVTELLDQCERDSIEEFSRLTKDSFGAMCADANVTAVFDKAVSDVFRSILEREFAQLSEEVLLRRRVGHDELKRQLNARS